MSRAYTIAGCQAAVDAARAAVEREGLYLATLTAECDAVGKKPKTESVQPFIKAQKTYADALEQLAEALRG